MKRLEADTAYRSSLSNMLRLWLQLDASVLMSQVEDVFTLPPDFQTKIFTLNQQFAKQGTMGAQSGFRHRCVSWQRNDADFCGAVWCYYRRHP